MAAESPTTERDVFTYERSGTPPPNTSAYIPKPEIVPSSSEKPEKTEKSDHEKDKKEKDGDDSDDEKTKLKDYVPDPGANPGHKNQDNAITKADKGDRRDERNDDKNKKMNGNDKLDGKWLPPPPKNEEEEEDGCVKCLYYSMQCCECTIV